MTDKQTLVAMLYKFAGQRPGLEYGNYGDPVAYRAELRSITKDLGEAKKLLRFIELRDSITADDILQACESAYAGRLSIKRDSDKFLLDYTTGQYWPTEYRRAVCAVCASAIWSYFRDNMPTGSTQGATEGAMLYRNPNGHGFVSAGDYLRKQCRNEFGRGIGNRWFQ